MKANIVCDYRRLSSIARRSRSKQPLVYLSADTRFGNVYLEPALISRDLCCPLDSVSQDLCEIAAYVYMGDKAVSRGRYEKWTRTLSFLIPVWNPDRWNSVKEILTNTIGTLSGDNVEFHFVSKANRKESTARPSPSTSTRFTESDCSCLFSGGVSFFCWGNLPDKRRASATPVRKPLRQRAQECTEPSGRSYSA